MSSIHIIVLFAAAIFLVAAYAIAKVHLKPSLVSGEQDFITEILTKKRKSLRATGVSLSMDWYLRLLLICPLVIGVLLFLFTENGLLAVLGGVAGLFVPEGIVFFMKQNDERKFEERYARSLEQLSSSLRAGLSISQAVDDVANCKFLHESMRKKYANMSSDLQMGLSVAEAFRRFANGTNNPDAEDVAMAIDIQNEVGGHEAEVIQDVAVSIKDRIMMRREIKSVFASTSSMIWIMDFIVPGVIIFFSMTSRSYVEVYFENPFFTIIFAACFILPLIGSFINHKTLQKVKKGS